MQTAANECAEKILFAENTQSSAEKRVKSKSAVIEPKQHKGVGYAGKRIKRKIEEGNYEHAAERQTHYPE